jgi:hypothetical protein
MREHDLRTEDRREDVVNTVTGSDEPLGILPEDELALLRQRWDDIQTGFVDDPRISVENADRLVADTVERLIDSFARTREKLEETWARGEEASTEDFRIALQRYRAFFNRLLTT